MTQRDMTEGDAISMIKSALAEIETLALALSSYAHQGHTKNDMGPVLSHIAKTMSDLVRQIVERQKVVDVAARSLVTLEDYLRCSHPPTAEPYVTTA